MATAVGVTLPGDGADNGDGQPGQPGVALIRAGQQGLTWEDRKWSHLDPEWNAECPFDLRGVEGEVTNADLFVIDLQARAGESGLEIERQCAKCGIGSGMNGRVELKNCHCLPGPLNVDP